MLKFTGNKKKACATLFRYCPQSSLRKFPKGAILSLPVILILTVNEYTNVAELLHADYLQFIALDSIPYKSGA